MVINDINCPTTKANNINFLATLSAWRLNITNGIITSYNLDNYAEAAASIVSDSSSSVEQVEM